MSKDLEETKRGYNLIAKEYHSLRISGKKFHNAIDLSNSDDIVYRDKGYNGTPTRAKGNGTMCRGNLTPHEMLRNKRISKKRNQGEHPFRTIHRAMNGGNTKLTTLYRVFIQQLFVFSAYNIYRLATLTRMQ